jgi:hypothetical protein
MATPAEIAALRKVLYDPERNREFRTHLSSIDVLMNLSRRGRVAPKGVGVPGGGPTWFIPSTGAVNASVREAAARCRKIAVLIRETRRELAGVSFDATDKRDLLAALDAQAESWEARGAVWAAPGKPNVAADAKRVSGPEGEAYRRYQRVRDYLRAP